MGFKKLSASLERWLQGEDLLLFTEDPGEETEEKAEKTAPLSIKGSAEAPAKTVKRIERAGLRWGTRIYGLCAVLCCVSLIAVLLFTVSELPAYGERSALFEGLASEYLEEGMEETGAVNIVSAMILNYRAFDTLGESFVLFTALCCVIILLHIDSKNAEENLVYYDLSTDPILKRGIGFAAPMILLYGGYVIVNGHLSPGGGFSGGAIMGAGLILLSASYGFEIMDRLFTRRLFDTVTGCALGFYALSKTYSFFCEANGLDSHIPKGTPGTIFSGGLILPLNIAVGMVVAMTMFGMYCLFRRGKIGR